MAHIKKSALRIRRSTIAFAFAFVFFGSLFSADFVFAVVDCSKKWCVSGDTSMFGNSDLANTGSAACIGAVYAPECNSLCNNNGAGSEAETNFACVPAVSTGTGADNGGGSQCDSIRCYAQGQCPTGTSPSSSCGGTCPPPGGLTQLNTYCAPSSDNGVDNGGGGGTSTTGAKCAANFMEDPTTGVCFPTDTKLPDTPVLIVLGNFFGWLLAIFGFLAVGAFVISGIQYLIASGDEDMAKSAKRNMTWAVVGVIVGFSGYVILQAVFQALSANPFF